MTEGAPASGASRAPRLLASATLAFGGRVFRFVPADPSVPIAVFHPHTSFLIGDDVPADLEVTCAFGDPSPSPGEPDLDAAAAWQLRCLADGSEEICFFGRFEQGGEQEPYARLTMDPEFRRARVVQRPIVEGETFFRVGYPLDEYLAARLLGRAGALVLHGAALADGGGAYVFAGHSGAGKSTISGLAESAGARVLSDDRTILVPEGGGVRAWGTPWHGTYQRGENEARPLRAIYLLVQSSEDRVVPLRAAVALQELFVRLIQPTIAPEEVAGSLDALERIVTSVPVAELHFRPTAAAWALARAAAAR
jgi:hypothetical protein